MAWNFWKKYHGALVVLVLLHLFKRVSTERLIAWERRSVSTIDLLGAEHLQYLVGYDSCNIS